MLQLKAAATLSAISCAAAKSRSLPGARTGERLTGSETSRSGTTPPGEVHTSAML